MRHEVDSLSGWVIELSESTFLLSWHLCADALVRINIKDFAISLKDERCDLQELL